MNNNQPNIKNYAEFLRKLSANELTLLATAAGFVLSQGLTGLQASSLGNFFELVGQVMLTYGAQEQLLKNIRDNYNLPTK